MRKKADMTVPRIAEELGRGEQTIRFYLTGKTEAGKLVRGNLRDASARRKKSYP